MILLSLIAILLVGGLLAWLVARRSLPAARWISLVAVSLNLLLILYLCVRDYRRADFLQHSRWLEELDWNWIPRFGIRFHLAMDGLSLLLLILTFILGIASVLASWKEIREGVGFFHFNLLWVLAGITSVFLAMDLFLFYFAWELMLVPMYFLHRDLGPRTPGLCGGEVLPVYATQQSAHAGSHPGALLYSSSGYRRLHV